MPRRDFGSLLGLMHEVELFRVPLMFGRAHADLTLSEGGSVATTETGVVGGGWRTAASKAVMYAVGSSFRAVRDGSG